MVRVMGVVRCLTFPLASLLLSLLLSLSYVEVSRPCADEHGRAHFVADCAAGYNKTVLPQSSAGSGSGSGSGCDAAPSVGAPIAAQHVGTARTIATTALCGAVAGRWTHFPSIELSIDDVCLEFAEQSGSEGGGSGSGGGAGTMTALLDLDELLTFKCYLRRAKVSFFYLPLHFI